MKFDGNEILCGRWAFIPERVPFTYGSGQESVNVAFAMGRILRPILQSGLQCNSKDWNIYIDERSKMVPLILQRAKSRSSINATRVLVSTYCIGSAHRHPARHSPSNIKRQGEVSV